MTGPCSRRLHLPQHEIQNRKSGETAAVIKRGTKGGTPSSWTLATLDLPFGPRAGPFKIRPWYARRKLHDISLARARLYRDRFRLLYR